MDRLNLQFEIKQVDAEQRIIEGYAAVFGNLDRAGDIIDVGAFDATLEGRQPTDIAVFIGHDVRQLPVGVPLEIRADGKGLWTRTQVFETNAGNDLLTTAKSLRSVGKTLGMSIGFWTKEYDWDSEGSVRHLKAIDLVEYSYASAQTIANPEALVTGVKQMEDKTAIAAHSTPTDTDAKWDGPAVVSAAPNEAKVLRYMHAWKDKDGAPDAKQSYKFPHHGGRTGAAAVIAGVNNALARLPQASIPADDRAGVEAHLRKHRKDAGLEEDKGADLTLMNLAVKLEDASVKVALEMIAMARLGIDIKAGSPMRKELKGIIAEVEEELKILRVEIEGEPPANDYLHRAALMDIDLVLAQAEVTSGS